jgi:ATP-dependent DNA helicase RecG
MSDLPKWADVALSAELASLRERGEGRDLEFKRDFPPQVHDLAEVIAAFATSGGGRVLIGVEDDGNLHGIDAPDGSARDKIVQRAQGIVRAVRPDVKAAWVFGVEQGITVLCIHVPPQQEPVYYYDGRPYVRDDRVSRRATPEEVQALIWKHPSAEFARRAEELKLRNAELQMQNVQQFMEDSRRTSQLHDEMLMEQRSAFRRKQ